MTAATTSLRCPVALCGRENAYGTEFCAHCRTPLAGYERLRTHPARLFNQGLAAAREGRLAAARDRFAAVVHWCPGDTEARNALALAARLLGDHDEACRQWGEVLGRRPGDPKATRGLAELERLPGQDGKQAPEGVRGPGAEPG